MYKIKTQRSETQSTESKITSLIIPKNISVTYSLKPTTFDNINIDISIKNSVNYLINKYFIFCTFKSDHFEFLKTFPNETYELLFFESLSKKSFKKLNRL